MLQRKQHKYTLDNHHQYDKYKGLLSLQYSWCPEINSELGYWHLFQRKQWVQKYTLDNYHQQEKQEGVLSIIAVDVCDILKSTVS